MNFTCANCGSKWGYIREGGRVPLCKDCRITQGISLGHPSYNPPNVTPSRPVYEDDDDSPILEDTRSGDKNKTWGA